MDHLPSPNTLCPQSPHTVGGSLSPPSAPHSGALTAFPRPGGGGRKGVRMIVGRLPGRSVWNSAGVWEHFLVICFRSRQSIHPEQVGGGAQKLSGWVGNVLRVQSPVAGGADSQVALSGGSFIFSPRDHFENQKCADISGFCFPVLYTNTFDPFYDPGSQIKMMGQILYSKLFGGSLCSYHGRKIWICKTFLFLQSA